jgi:hypothetical protein
VSLGGNESLGPLPGLPTSPYDTYSAGRTYSRARNALILGIIAIFPLSILAGIPAVVVGSRALRLIRDSDGALRGRAVAWAGILLGCLSVAEFAAFIYRSYGP